MSLSDDDLAYVRLSIGDLPAVGAEPLLSDDQINGLATRQGGNLTKTVREGWKVKAALYAELVDTDESGSARKYSQLYKNASAQVKYWDGQVVIDQSTASAANRGIGRSVAPWSPTTRCGS